jgi:phage-related protein
MPRIVVLLQVAWIGRLFVLYPPYFRLIAALDRSRLGVDLVLAPSCLCLFPTSFCLVFPLDLKTRARFRWSAEQLRVRNVRAREPLVRHLEGNLWELREESSTNIYRVIYVFFTGRPIVLLHGFQKKTQRTPRGELETARMRYEAFIQRERR